jgi:hypothetical protein
MMKQNLGPSDRILRMSMAGILITAFLTHFLTGAVGISLALLGLVLVMTSLVGYCPLYRIFGWSTSRRHQDLNP